jgi:glycerophosphoryl diester phosphodiesterase
MPENTIPAFLKAIELGVTTLELDLVISGDHQVVVSHEPYFKAAFSTDPEGNPVLPEEQKEHNLYKLSYEEIKQYDVGQRIDPQYPDSKRMPVAKPLLSDVFDEVKTFCSAQGLKIPFFNIEIKRVESMDSVYHPPVREFVDLVLAEVEASGLSDYITIQSFDKESLRVVRQAAPHLPLALLIEGGKDASHYIEQIEDLGFKPDIYSCYFGLVNEDLISHCKAEEIRVIPWTVNQVDDMKKLIDLGVDGIITDYPDRLIELMK